MFTIENFIHGIANVTKSLKASICGDSLIVNRICYDYETSNDYEELFAQISLEQIQPIIELLADNYTFLILLTTLTFHLLFLTSQICANFAESALGAMDNYFHTNNINKT